MCLIINYFVTVTIMYYSNLQVNYMCNGVVVKGQDTGSGVNKVETTAGVWQQSVFTCSAADSFQHTQNHHAHA